MNLPLLCLALLFPVTAGLAQTYTNPVGGDIRMGDPFVLRYEGRYYLYGTTSGDGFKAWTATNPARC